MYHVYVYKIDRQQNISLYFFVNEILLYHKYVSMQKQSDFFIVNIILFELLANFNYAIVCNIFFSFCTSPLYLKGR